MRFWKRKKKKYEQAGELEMRLHRGMSEMRRENTALYKFNRQLCNRIMELEKALADTALERDKLLAWWEKHKDRLEELEREAGNG